jgi:peptidoglycan/LPS O-acetylase OafA/YrhL
MNPSEADKAHADTPTPESTLQSLTAEVAALKARNARVEAAKGWEQSSTRRILIAAFTYIVIVLFFLAAGLPNPFVNALVPTVGFLLSTLSLEAVRRRWGEGEIK